MNGEERRAAEHNARPTLFIIRGAPGSGKTALARTIAPAASFSADDWFDLRAGEKDSTYLEVFDPADLDRAHGWCRDKVCENMLARLPRIAVANTFVEAWMMEPYLELAGQHGYKASVILMQNDFGNDHGVPEPKVKKMRRDLYRCPFIHTVVNGERLPITEQG